MDRRRAVGWGCAILLGIGVVVHYLSDAGSHSLLDPRQLASERPPEARTLASRRSAQPSEPLAAANDQLTCRSRTS